MLAYLPSYHLLVLLPSPLPILIPFEPKYSPQHPVFKYLIVSLRSSPNITDPFHNHIAHFLYHHTSMTYSHVLSFPCVTVLYHHLMKIEWRVESTNISHHNSTCGKSWKLDKLGSINVNGDKMDTHNWIWYLIETCVKWRFQIKPSFNLEVSCTLHRIHK